MSFDKLHKWWNRQSAIVVVYVVVMLLPDVLLAITEPYSFTTVTASLLMPGAVYLLLAVALKRPGLLMLCSFPLMVLGAFQIVLLYLFGGPLLSPMFAGAAMSLSSVCVVGNALRLGTVKL